jgi:transcriptional regulator with XRE-family HTH domain
MNISQALARKIKTVRRQAGLTQTQLGERVGISQSHISAWERGLWSPTVSSLAKIAAATNTQLEIKFR